MVAVRNFVNLLTIKRMTEKQYIDVSNLAKLQAIQLILRDIMDYDKDNFHDEMVKVRNIVSCEITKLHEKIKIR